MSVRVVTREDLEGEETERLCELRPTPTKKKRRRHLRYLLSRHRLQASGAVVLVLGTKSATDSFRVNVRSLEVAVITIHGSLPQLELGAVFCASFSRSSSLYVYRENCGCVPWNAHNYCKQGFSRSSASIGIQTRRITRPGSVFGPGIFHHGPITAAAQDKKQGASGGWGSRIAATCAREKKRERGISYGVASITVQLSPSLSDEREDVSANYQWVQPRACRTNYPNGYVCHVTGRRRGRVRSGT